ncbi:hypothetical protein Tco_0964074 [Tanacetum coccineum]
MNLSTMRGLVSRTYSEKSLAMVLIYGFKLKSFTIMSTTPPRWPLTMQQELESIECRVESLMRNEVLLEYEVGFTIPKRPYQEELEARILNLIDHQEDQVRKLEEDMRKTKDTFMCLADSLIATLKVEIEAQRVHSIEIEKITRFPTHTPTVTLETLKPTIVHRVSM